MAAPLGAPVGDHLPEEIDQAIGVVIEDEVLALAPDVLAQLRHARFVAQLLAQLGHVREEEPDVEVARQGLRGHDGALVVALQERQARGDERRDARGVVQVVPVRAAQVALVLALEEMQPAGVVL